MKIRKYRLTVKHDKGRVNFIVIASSEADAKNLVCKAEGCPERAIIKIKPLFKV